MTTLQVVVSSSLATTSGIDALVKQARRDGLTWVEISSALGEYHEATMERYADRA